MINFRGHQYRAADSSVDREYRQEAKKAYQDLIRYLKKPDPAVDELMHGEGYILYFDQVDPRYEKLVIQWKSSYKRKSLGTFTERANWLYPESRDYAVTMYTLGDNFFTTEDNYEKPLYDSLQNIWTVTHEQIFVHEFIHYLDRLRRKKQIPFKSLKELGTQKTTTEYLSDPDEFNAWYQQKVAELEDVVNAVGEAAPDVLVKNWLSAFDDFMKLARTQFASGVVGWDLDSLDKKYKQKLLKRLYGLWDDYKNQYRAAGKTPTTQDLGRLVEWLGSNEAYRWLPYDSWLSGGCWLLGEALVRLLPGSELWWVMDGVKDQPQHAVVKYRGIFIDGSGVHHTERSLLDYQQEEEWVDDAYLAQQPDTTYLKQQGLRCRYDQVDTLTEMLRAVLESPSSQPKVAAVTQLKNPTRTMVDFFEKRTLQHINRVIKFMRQLDGFGEFSLEELRERAKLHDQDKYTDPEMVLPYVWITEYYRVFNQEGAVDDALQQQYDLSNEASGKHVERNLHHPEAHESIEDMTALDLAEMVCDWASMAEELNQGSPRGWADQNVGSKWKFSDDQVDFIYRCIDWLEEQNG